MEQVEPKVQKYKYIVLTKTGKREPWTGIFDNLELALAWNKKYGAFHKKRGHDLLLTEASNSENNDVILDEDDDESNEGL